MEVRLKSKFRRVRADRTYKLSDFLEVKSRVSLKNVTIKVVACNMEMGKYQRGSGTNTRTVSFSEPVHGVTLHSSTIDHIPARVPLRRVINAEFSFEKMFHTLYPPVPVSDTHGLSTYWEIQVIHPDLIDQEIIPCVKIFRYDDFENYWPEKEDDPENDVNFNPMDELFDYRGSRRG